MEQHPAAAAQSEAARLADIARLFELANDLLATATPDGYFVQLNPAWEQALGWTIEELRSRPYLDFVHPDDREATAAVSSDGALAGKEIFNFENRYRHQDGSWRWLLWSARSDGDRWYAVAHDVTERKELERRAARDPLTGLPNRFVLTDRLGVALTQMERRGGCVAVLFIDLDRFKLANDTLGHRLGDELLIAAARRLESLVREGDTVARLGGDEFVILADGVWDREGAEAIAVRVVAAFERTFEIGGEPVSCTASVGVALAFPGDRPDPDVLLHRADIAMYRAKSGGRDRFELFDEAMRVEVESRREIASELRHAIDRGELWLAYQPIVSIADGTIVACEALLRWNHPERGAVAPADFIALAEEHGLIHDIGRWVLENACAQAARWRRAGKMVPVSVNVSPSQLLQPGFAGEIHAALASAQLPAAALGIEIIEASVVSQPEMAAIALTELKGLGVRISIDDFGRGATSLSYFRSLPLDEVKLDRAFVQGLGAGSVDRAIVAALVSLADEMALTLVAEGIESESELAELRRLGCQLAQGFWFSRPMPPDALELGGYQSRVRPGLGDPSVIREFMRQIGLPARM